MPVRPPLTALGLFALAAHPTLAQDRLVVTPTTVDDLKRSFPGPYFS